MRVKGLLLVAGMVFVMSSCTSFKERFHFRASDGKTTNYYRVTIDGHTYFAKAQYAAGLYDSEAVDNLFGELKGKTVHAIAPESPEADSEQSETAPATGLQSIDGKSMEGRKLVLFLSTNSDSLVRQIKTFVESRQIQESMVTLILKDDIERKQILEAQEDGDRAQADGVAAELKALADKIAAESNFDASTSDEMLAELSTILARASVAGHSGIEFKSMTEANQWFGKHPDAFERERK